MSERGALRERELFNGTRFSNLCTAVDTPLIRQPRALEPTGI
jgi:hypothetical protein